MKIALLTDGIHPYVIGGMQRHSFFLAKYLALNGISVDLYHTPGNGEHDISELKIFSEEEKNQIRSFVIPFPPAGRFPGHYLRRSYAYSELIYDLYRKNGDVDFIYTKGFTGWKLIEERSKGISFPPVSVKFHGMNMFQRVTGFKNKLGSYFFRKPVKFIMSHSDYVFSYGGKITTIIEKNQISRQKIIEIPAGIESSWTRMKIPPTSGTRKFLFIGRYDPVKGIRELYRSIKLINGRFPFEFHFVGPVPQQVQIKSNNVKYWGLMTDQNRLFEVIDPCDILVCPSYSEGMPNVILECMARGLAVIATDVGAVNTMVNSRNGWLIKSPDPALIAQSLVKAVQIPDERLDEMKYASVQKIRDNFLWEDIIKVLINKISGICQTSQAR